MRYPSLTQSISMLAFLAVAGIGINQAQAQPFAFANPGVQPGAFESVAPVEPDATAPEAADDTAQLPERLRRQIVAYNGPEAPGTIVIDTPNTYLYLVQPNHTAIRYGIGVGREGFTWAGTQTVARKAEWPDWFPPPEMIKRQPYLPRFVAGGESNPLGARAMYLGNTEYRIHGTNDPTTIGKNVSSGCIRLTNSDVEDLYAHVNVGTKVVVLPMNGSRRQTIARRHEGHPAASARSTSRIAPVAFNTAGESMSGRGNGRTVGLY